MKSPLWLLAILLLTPGCGSLLPSKRVENASIKAVETVGQAQAATVKRVVSGTPAPPPANISIQSSGASNNIVVNPEQPPVRPYIERTDFETSLDQTAGSSETANSALKVSVPMWVNLLGFGIAFGLIFYLWRAVLAKSAAVRAVAGAADETFASWIRENREKSSASSDHAEMARLNAENATIEQERAKLAAKAAKH